MCPLLKIWVSPSISALVRIREYEAAAWRAWAPAWAMSRSAAFASPAVFRGRATTMSPSVSWSKIRGAMKSGRSPGRASGPGLILLWAVSEERSWRLITSCASAVNPISPTSNGTSVPSL